MNEATPPGYALEFSDEFDDPDLDRAKWFPYMLPHWSDLESSAARFATGDGSLRLLIDHDQGRWRAGFDRASNLATGSFSGPRGSAIGQFRFDRTFLVSEEVPVVRTYTPLFGYFETRVRAVPIVGYHVALWMIGFDAAPAGEIRVFEIHGGNIHPDRSRIDYGILRWDDPILRDELYEDHLPIDASEFHTYAVDWTPTHVDFFVDGQRLRRIDQSPQYEMQFMLGVYERPHEVVGAAAGHDWPRAMEVDWFRGYRPASGRPGGGPVTRDP
jgi:hypothetical protein